MRSWIAGVEWWGGKSLLGPESTEGRGGMRPRSAHAALRMGSDLQSESHNLPRFHIKFQRTVGVDSERLRFFLNQVGLPGLLDGPEQFYVSGFVGPTFGLVETQGDGIVVLVPLQSRHDQVARFKAQEFSG